MTLGIKVFMFVSICTIGIILFIFFSWLLLSKAWPLIDRFTTRIANKIKNKIIVIVIELLYFPVNFYLLKIFLNNTKTMAFSFADLIVLLMGVYSALSALIIGKSQVNGILSGIVTCFKRNKERNYIFLRLPKYIWAFFQYTFFNCVLLSVVLTITLGVMELLNGNLMPLYLVIFIYPVVSVFSVYKSFKSDPDEVNLRRISAYFWALVGTVYLYSFKLQDQDKTETFLVELVIISLTVFIAFERLLKQYKTTTTNIKSHEMKNLLNRFFYQ